MNLTETIEKDRNKFENSNARSHIGRFGKRINPKLHFTDFHVTYYNILNKFAHGDIKKLIISVPPQHGKSEGSTRLLVPYMLGLSPDLKIAIGSYAATKAQKFNREIQRYIDNNQYDQIFEKTKINSTNVVTVSGSWLRNSSEFEIIECSGGLKAVGRGGGITGDPVDVWILDDVYKDLMEANSTTVREAAWEWFGGSVQTRTHNDTQELIVFTRWSPDDIIGRLIELGEVIEVNSWDELEKAPKNKYILVNFEAIKESEPTEFDPREKGDVLWEEKHSKELLTEKRNRSPLVFDCLYQGKPESKEGVLYGDFKEYDEMPTMIIGKGNCTDTADEGDDYLCSINYNKVRIKRSDDEKMRTYIYITDILYTQAPMEITEKEVAMMLDGGGIKMAHVESNNGGKGFARKVKGYLKGACKVIWYHQSHNKESRILTNSSTVTDRIIMPIGWKNKYPEVNKVLSTYKKLFKANKHDDLPDVLTAIIEKEIAMKSGGGVKRRN